MQHESAFAALSRLGAPAHGVVRGEVAVRNGISRKQLARWCATGVVERVLPDTYRIVAVAPSGDQRLRAALLWAGDRAAADGRSAGELYRLEGIRAEKPEIVVPRSVRASHSAVLVHHSVHRKALMVRTVGGIRVTGVEATLLRLAHLLEAEAFEVAYEDARRRRLTSVPALRVYLDRFGQRGRPGVATTRRLLRELDPVYAARSTLEVKTRRLLVAHGIDDFIREYPLEWEGRTYRYDFAFPEPRVILETNGRRWHDDPSDYEHDNEKWSVPGRHGYRIVFATWGAVTGWPRRLLDELRVALAA